MQQGGSKCSLCGSQGVTKTTCPCNPSASKPNWDTHPNATTVCPDVQKPVAKKPAAKKPVAKKPVAKKPVAKKPVQDTLALDEDESSYSTDESGELMELWRKKTAKGDKGGWYVPLTQTHEGSSYMTHGEIFENKDDAVMRALGGPQSGSKITISEDDLDKQYKFIEYI